MLRVVHFVLATLWAVTAGAESCESYGSYTEGWFADRISPEYRYGLTQTALFYTRGMSEQARNITRKNESMTTIWNIWPCNFYDKEVVPLRCIPRDRLSQESYFGNMSAAFARMARDTAIVLHDKPHFNTPPTDGIWATREYPVLITSGTVKVLIKTNGSYSERFWPVHGPSLDFDCTMGAQVPLRSYPIYRREDGAHCLAPSRYKELDDLLW